MDFHTLLNVAEQSHEKTLERPNKFKSTKVAAPKKDPKAKKLSENVQKFLDRRKAEEDRKKQEDERQKNNLKKLRADSKESQKVVKRMLSKNKAVNYSVMEDAINDRDTADTLAGRHQCDEDDYGYESNMARNLYDKLMTKYESNPDDPMSKFTKPHAKNSVKDAKSTIARVKEALLKGDEPLPKFSEKSKKRTKDQMHDDFINDGPIVVGESVRRKESSENQKRNDQDAKKKKRPPEAPSFDDLLKLAAKAKSSPQTTGEEKPLVKKDKDVEKRPMTKKQREDFERQRQSELRKAGKLTTADKGVYTKKSIPSKPSSYNQQHKKQDTNKLPNQPAKMTYPSHDTTNGKSRFAPPQSTSNFNKTIYSKADDAKRKVENNNGAISKHNGSVSLKSTKFKEHPVVASKSNSSDLQKKKTVISNLNKVEARQFPGEKSAPKYHSKVKRSRSRSPIPQTSKSNGMRIESDSEYDSEMDDFIDDSDAKVDISAEIRNIFGYDRRKFRHEEDFDDRAMENNRFSDVMREEARSAKIGKMEDLEDMRREEEEKKRKALMKKARR